MPSGEIHVQLSATFAGNRKVRALVRFGTDARLARDLYVQMLCYAKTMLSDGFVPAEEIGILVYPDAPEVGERNAGQLVTVGLIEPLEGGYQITGWFERNPTREDIRNVAEAKSTGGAIGNHRRWHLGRRFDPKCQYCIAERSDTDRTSDRSSDDNRSDTDGSANRPPTHSESSETETETETGKPTSAPGRRRSKHDYGDDEGFARFWEVFPVKRGKPNAYREWRAALKRGADPEQIIKAAMRYRDDPSRDPRHSKYPEGWLSDERYNDASQSDDDRNGYDPEDVWNER